MVQEIGAEFLLNYIYPQLRNEWGIVMRGSFYRNYSNDVLRLDVDDKYVELSRDSFLKLLPDVMLSPEDEQGDNEQKHRRLQLLEEAFAPVDTFHFNAKLRAEANVSELLSRKMSYILLHYFDYNLKSERNEYCRQVAPLLPYASRLRGDIHFVRKLLSTLTHYPVQIRQTAWSDTDNSKYWMPKVYYDIIINNLSPAQYREEMNKLIPLGNLLRERFLPFDIIVEIGIKGDTELGIIDYNIRTKS